MGKIGQGSREKLTKAARDTRPAIKRETKRGTIDEAGHRIRPAKQFTNLELKRVLVSYNGASKRGFKPLFLFLPPSPPRGRGTKGDGVDKFPISLCYLILYNYAIYYFQVIDFKATFVYTGTGKANISLLVVRAGWYNPFPSRTRKLNALAQTILRGQPLVENMPLPGGLG